MLIVFGGLPGVGKTTLSRMVAREVGAVWLRVDAIEVAIWRSGIQAPVGPAGYDVAEALADANLTLGRTVVVDAVNPLEISRRPWRALAARHGVPLRVIEVVCSDQDEHRRRVEQREPDLQGFVVPTWQEVQSREYESWAEPRLTVDSAGDFGDGLPRILDYIAPAGGSSGHQPLQTGEGEARDEIESEVPGQRDGRDAPQ